MYWISRSRKRGTKCYDAMLRRANAMTVCLSSSSLIPILFPPRCFSFRSFEQKLRLQSAYVYYSVQQFDSHIAASYVRAGTVSSGKHPTNPLPLLGEPRVKGESTGKRDRDYSDPIDRFRPPHRWSPDCLFFLDCFSYPCAGNLHQHGHRYVPRGIGHTGNGAHFQPERGARHGEVRVLGQNWHADAERDGV